MAGLTLQIGGIEINASFLRFATTGACGISTRDYQDAIQALRAFYLFRSYPDVSAYLREHSNLIPTLIAARREITKYFGPAVACDLDARPDFDAPQRIDLHVTIQTPYGAKESRRRMDAFYDEWWVEHMDPAGRQLIFSLSFV